MAKRTPEDVGAYIREALASVSANRGATPEQALTRVRQGLTLAEDNCAVLQHLGSPDGHGLRSEHWRSLRQILLLVFDSAVNGVPGPVEALAREARKLRKTSKVLPIGAEPISSQDLARSMAEEVRLLKMGGTDAALRAKFAAEGKPVEGTIGSATTPASRFEVAQWLAIFTAHVAPDLAPQTRLDTIREKLPMGHGHEVDRSLRFESEPFQGNPEKAVIAAFKAVGYDPKKADQLFKAQTMKRSRATKRRKAKR